MKNFPPIFFAVNCLGLTTDKFEGTDLLHGTAKIITFHLSFYVSNFDRD